MKQNLNLKQTAISMIKAQKLIQSHLSQRSQVPNQSQRKVLSIRNRAKTLK